MNTLAVDSRLQLVPSSMPPARGPRASPGRALVVGVATVAWLLLPACESDPGPTVAGHAQGGAPTVPDGGQMDTADGSKVPSQRLTGNPSGSEDAAVSQDAASDDIDAGLPEVAGQPEDEAAHVFDQQAMHAYNLVIDPADLASIDADPAAETYVDGQLEFEGATYGPLSIRYKGSVGAFLPPCTGSTVQMQTSARGPRTGKCSFKVDFNRVDRELRFFGLKKLNFHSMNIDPSLMRDRLGYAMFREFGLAAPRAVHARLSVNGKLRGLYIVVEQIDGRFTKQRFRDGGDGNVYKEVWPESPSEDTYRAALRTNEDQSPSLQKMLDFAAAMAGGEDVSDWLDVDYMLRYIAVDRVIVNDDGPLHSYCGFRHNFYWYEAEAAQRFWLIPWDLDASFQLGDNQPTHIEPAWNTPTMDCMCNFTGGLPSATANCDPLLKQFVRRNDAYEEAVDRFLAGPFRQSNVSAKLEAWRAQVDATVMEVSGLDGAITYEGWQRSFASFQAHIATAREHRGYPY